MLLCSMKCSGAWALWGPGAFLVSASPCLSFITLVQVGPVSYLISHITEFSKFSLHTQYVSPARDALDSPGCPGSLSIREGKYN